MSRTIDVSEDVYHELKRMKGDRSFSEVIQDVLDRELRIEDVAGTGILDEETSEEVRTDLDQLHRRTQFEEGFSAFCDVDFQSIDDLDVENHRQ